MITIKNVTMKNFMSVGNNTQAVVLNNTGLTLVLGDNVDQGSTGSRNGVGKTTMIQAISFALFGQPLTNIKKDNLINKTNQKQMVVSLEFESDGRTYKVERGRKPNFMRYIVNDSVVNAPDTDESHGESKWTQREIEKVIGMSHTLFKHIVALHTKTVPFLSLGDAKQREIIEELISITQLSDKAESLKALIKEIRDEIKNEDVRIQTITNNNARVQKAIDELNFKSRMWDREHDKKLEKIAVEIAQLEQINIDSEIDCHRRSTKWYETAGEVATLDKEVTRYGKQIANFERQTAQLQARVTSTEANSCPTCGQDVHDDTHERIHRELMEQVAEINSELATLRSESAAYEEALLVSATLLASLGEEPLCTYSNIEQALDHRNRLERRRADLEREAAVENPTIEQIANLSMTALQDISYEYLNELSRLKEHQEFLLKLLTSKDSFIRKKIIDQNLSYLNHRLNSYLDKLALPHEVVFKSDLSVEITQLGKDFDFEQLSNGEANRLVLALSWSFRDMWESMNQPMNLLIIDELVDSGMDSQGMEAALDILKKQARERSRNIFLVSHKDELISRVGRIMMVQKENNFTSYHEDQELPGA